MRACHLFDRLFVGLLLSVASVFADIPGLNAPGWQSGYSEIVQGNPFSYHSPHPEINQALLARANGSENVIEWKTAPVPHAHADSVHFVWMFGIDANPVQHQFTLYLNDDEILSFKNPSSAEDTAWSVNGRYGSRLTFRVTLVDKHSDLMGFATLTLPASLLNPGEPVRLRVVGADASSRVWYMTFMDPLIPDVEVKSENAIIKTPQGKKQPVRINICYLGPETEIVAEAEGLPPIKRKIRSGYNFTKAPLTPVQKKQKKVMSIRVGQHLAVERSFEILPARPWTLYLVTHSHTDIGYTRPQSEILPEHLRFIDYALDYCDLTDDYPDYAKFRWVCESSWAVREYLNRRPKSQVERLVKRVKEGRIELTGMFFNMSEILDENMAAAQLQPVRLFRQAGMGVSTAMQNDVNGMAWCLVDYFSDAGIKYVSMGEHGHRALIPFDKPTPFWWESPAGKRVLAFRAEHYNTGNFWGIHTGNMDLIEQPLLSYLNGLAEKGYPFDEVSIQYSGFFTDNSAPSMVGCDIVRQWNEKYEWPHLKTATQKDFLDHIASQYADQLPRYRVAWPDWWTDGFGSAARETGYVRKTQADITATLALFALARLKGLDLPPEIGARLNEVNDALLFYDEHTFGAAESISNPLGENSMVQWGEKSAYAWEAVKKAQLFREEAFGVIAPILAKSQYPTITVFNPLNWTRSGAVSVYIDHELLKPDQSFTLFDEDGQALNMQRISTRADGSYWTLFARNIPGFGFKTFRLVVKDEPRRMPERINDTSVLENQFYRLVIDGEAGGIKSFYDKEMGLELVDQSSRWKLGQPIYEELSNRHQLERFTLEEAKRSTLENVTVERGIDGPVWKSLVVSGRLKGCDPNGGFSMEIRLFKELKRVDLCYRINKMSVYEPEALYVAFPFALDQNRHFFEVQGGVVRPGIDQLEGTASDWNTVQNFVGIRNADKQIIVSPDQAPLVMLGGLNIGNYQYISKPASSHLFSYVLNNYWTTNFRATQEGELSWSYSITSADNPSNVVATQFGWASRVPLIARVRPPATVVQAPDAGPALDLDIDNILMVSARPAQLGNAIVLNLREIDGRNTKIPVKNILGAGIKKVCLTNAIETEDLEVESAIDFSPYENKFIKLWF